MDIAFVAVAFLFGFAAATIRLPPLVGYLAAGFVLHAFGFDSTETIETIADLGVMLLLFGIGLKLKLRTLARPVVWGGATIHLAMMTLLFSGAFGALGALGLSVAAELSFRQLALAGFAFAFSSTVFAVKALEERNEAASLSGRIAVGILIVQDLFAVAFLTLAADASPSLWAIPVVAAVLLARPVYGWLLDRSGHGELLVLLGFFLAIAVGAETFDQVGLKPDLGALLVGLALSGHRRAAELAERLLSFKDLLLIGFFLSIGLGGAPGLEELILAAAVLLILPIKTGAYLWVLTRFRLRSRTSWHASVTLANFSEFGLIVTAVGVERGFLDQAWAAVVAIAVAASFALAAPANTARYEVYRRFGDLFAGLERHPIQEDDAIIDPGDAQILVFGMGRVGAGAYDELVARRGEVVLGVDRRDETVVAQTDRGRRVVRGDALDNDFWDRLALHPGIQMVLLAMNDHEANLEAVRRVKDYLPGVLVAAAATFPDQIAELGAAGVDTARNLYAEAGQGLAADACDLLDLAQPTPPE